MEVIEVLRNSKHNLTNPQQIQSMSYLLQIFAADVTPWNACADFDMDFNLHSLLST